MCITKTCLYNNDTLKPHFYIVKLGLQGYTLFVLFLLKNRGGSNEYTQSMFLAEIWKISEILIWKFSVFGGEIFYIFEYACFRNGFASWSGIFLYAYMFRIYVFGQAWANRTRRLNRVYIVSHTSSRIL